jgi:HAD superfamily hydrolase (TIGR01509 family)
MKPNRSTDGGASKNTSLPPRVWLLDFDRTLAILEPEVDWSASRRALEAELAAAGTSPALLAELVAIHPRGNLVLYEALRARLFDGAAPPSASARKIIDRASALIERYEMAGADRAVPMPGAIALLCTLAVRRIPVAIVTSNSSVTVRRWLEKNRVREAVQIIVGRDSGLGLKPSPATVRRALELLEAQAEDAIFIGDSVADLEAARAAGVRFCAIAPDDRACAPLFTRGAREIFRSPEELAAHFEVG